MENIEWRREFQELLPDFSDHDVCSSCFAIQSYTVHFDFGGNRALERLRERLRKRGIRLLLDFVPNHTAPDHRWVQRHPDYYVQGTEEQLERAPQNYKRVATAGGPVVLAYGRDPCFAGWPDTLQLNYAGANLQQAMVSELEKIATMCDGVRCDMAMLVLPDVFERTWQADVAGTWIEEDSLPTLRENVRKNEIARHWYSLFLASEDTDTAWGAVTSALSVADEQMLNWYAAMENSAANPERAARRRRFLELGWNSKRGLPQELDRDSARRDHLFGIKFQRGEIVPFL